MARPKGTPDFRKYDAKDVDSYIARSAAEARPVMEKLRSIIKSTVPGVEEKISWGVPFYRYHGLLGGFAAYRSHISFGLIFVLQDKDRKELEEKGYVTGKKTFQIRFDQEIPATMVRKMILTQAKLNEAKK